MHKQLSASQNGFTLIELLVVMGIIAILASIVLVAMNPAKYFAQARNTQRSANVLAILDGVSQNMADNKGVLNCPANPNIPTTAQSMRSSGGYNIAACLVPTYIPALPFDPSAVGAHYKDPSDYDTGYTIIKDPDTGRVTISAPTAELGTAISISR